MRDIDWRSDCFDRKVSLVYCIHILISANCGSRGWTYLFYLLGGIAVIPITIGLLVIPKDDPSLRKVDEDRRIDWIGGFIVTAGLCLFCFSLTESGIAEKGWATPCKLTSTHSLFGPTDLR